MAENDIDDIRELDEEGFARTSSRLLYYIRKNDMPDIKFFRPGSVTTRGSRGSIKYSSSDIFGEHHAYCFDIKRKKEFVDFLVAKFFKVNENPDLGMRKVFSRILHLHGLHWEQCSCDKKKISMYDIENI